MRIEEFVNSSWGDCGRPEYDRGMLACAIVAKAVLRMSTTAGHVIICFVMAGHARISIKEYTFRFRRNRYEVGDVDT